MNPQECLNLARLLAAGLVSRGDVSSWAEAQLMAAPADDVPTLSDLILTAANSTADNHDLVVMLTSKGASASTPVAISGIASVLLGKIHKRELKPEDAFAHFARSVSVFELSHEQQALFNQIDIDLVSWPDNIHPWGELTGDLIPHFLRTVVGREEKTGAA